MKMNVWNENHNGNHQGIEIINIMKITNENYRRTKITNK